MRCQGRKYHSSGPPALVCAWHVFHIWVASVFCGDGLGPKIAVSCAALVEFAAHEVRVPLEHPAERIAARRGHHGLHGLAIFLQVGLALRAEHVEADAQQLDRRDRLWDRDRLDRPRLKLRLRGFAEERNGTQAGGRGADEAAT